MQAIKELTGKLSWDAFLWRAIERVNQRWQENKTKYSIDNHLKPISRTELEDAMFRHYLKMKLGHIDEDHLAAICMNALMLIEAELNETLIKDGIKETELYSSLMNKV